VGVELEYPFTGRWSVRNSPANRVPSHGTEALASSFAIDFVPVDAAGRTAPFSLRSLVRPEPAGRFPGFGRPILSPAAGTVVGAQDSAPDHEAFRGLPSVSYALSQRRRAALGWTVLAGNHVLVETDGRVVVAVCHLQRDSVEVRVGDRVSAGRPLGRCGNSGNSTEPHVHVQAFDRHDVAHAEAVPITFLGGLPRNGEIVDVPP